MTIASDISRNDYVLNGATTVYPYTFRILAAADLEVLTRSAAGVQTVLSYPADYAVSGVGNTVGGSVTLASAGTSGTLLVIHRDRTITQETDLANQGRYSPADVERALDSGIMIAQQLQEQSDRAFKIDPSLNPAGYDLVIAPRANEVVGWDTFGTALTSYPASTFGGTAASILTGFINVKDAPFSASGGGVSDDRGAVATAQAAVGSAGALYFPPGSYRINSNITLTTALWMAPGATLKPASGVTITIGGAVEAGMYQVFDCSLGGTVQFGVLGAGSPNDRSVGAVRPEWWGAVADGTTSSTSAMNAAINQNRRVLLSAGTYLANCVHTFGYLILDGAGNDATFIKSFTSSDYAFIEKFAGSGWRRHATLNDLCLLGDGLLRNGFSFGEPGGYTAGAELYGRCEFNRVQFQSCKVGILKLYGNIGNVYNDCTWRGTQDHCYYAVGGGADAWGVGTGPMQTGAELFNGGHMGEASLAAIYINDGPTAGQNVYNGLIIEGCAGFGVFVFNYPNQGAGAMAFNDVWMEANGTATTVTINSVVYTPGDFYFRNAENVHLNRLKMTGRIELVNSAVYEQGCTYYADTSVVDATSVRIIDNLYSSQANLTKGLVRSYQNLGAQFGGAGNIYTIPSRVERCSGYTSVWTEPYAGEGPWSFSGTGSVSASRVADGVLYPTSAELVVPNTFTLLPNVTEFTFTNGRYYVYTIDVKLVSATAPTSLTAAGAATLFPNASGRLVQGQWVTIGGIGQANATGTAIVPRITNSTGVSVTLRFSAAQVVEFTSKADAIAYFNARLYHEGQRLFQGSATFNPANLVDGAGETTTVTVTGAALGDRADATFGLDLQGILLTAWVSAANTVSVRFQNETGGTLDLASGTLRAQVRKWVT